VEGHLQKYTDVGQNLQLPSPIAFFIPATLMGQGRPITHH